jgi:deoxyribonuclease V
MRKDHRQTSWDVSEGEAKAIQLRLAPFIVCDDDWRNMGLLGGVSIRPIDRCMVRVSVCVLDLASMKHLDSSMETAAAPLSYIPGLRAFQAGPAIIAAFAKLSVRPDVILWDGHGIAHPMRCGLASHMGLVLDIPSVGVTEELLYGECRLQKLAGDRGSFTPILDPESQTEIGAAVRTRRDVRPVFVSVGHRVSLKSAVRIVLESTPRYRIPEPLRQARMNNRAAKSGG